MTETFFWKLIEQSKQGSLGCEDQAERLVRILGEQAPEEILGFDRLMVQFRHQAYRWDLWGVAYIVCGGCSDDGFEYFRGWLIAQGKDIYGEAMRSPETVANHLGDDEECEDILYSARRAYESKTGREMPDNEIPYPDPQGTPWKEEYLETLYPELCQRFWSTED